MSKKQIDKLVDRFLCWKLPENFCPDCGISFTPFHPNGTTRFEPVGTNLLTADQAKQMLSEVAPPDEEVIELMEATANMLRGMTMDPSIPQHAKSAMLARINQLEAAVENRIDG